MTKRLLGRVVIGVAAGVILVPGTASAHLVSTGAGPFYDGVAHFLASLDEVLPVVALGVLAGLRGPRAGRWLLAVLPAAWFLGGLVGLAVSVAESPTAATAALVLIPGALVAFDRELPVPVLAVLFSGFGLWCGVLNGSAMALAHGGWLGVTGAAAMSAVVATMVAAGAVVLGRGGARIVLRVAGSWLAAFGLLALGWALKVG